jgi:hypothetical protein
MQAAGWLAALRRQEDGRQEWVDWLRSTLPDDLGAAVVGARLKGSVLTVHAASAAWAARLRFAMPALGAALRERAPGVESVLVRVAPATTRAPSPGS